MTYRIIFGEPASFRSLVPGLFAFDKNQDTRVCIKLSRVLKSESGILSYTHATISNGEPLGTMDENQQVYPVELERAD